MPTIYKNAAGKRVPSVTTITGLYGDKGGLLYWANQQGLEGNSLEQARESTATVGTIVHAMVDAHIKKQDFDIAKYADEFSTPESFAEAREKAAIAFDAFKQWAAFSQFTLVEGEIPLVSEEHQFGGRLDAVMTKDGLALVDWKSGKGGTIYADFLHQLAGYSILWQESFPDNPITAGYHIIRFSREDGAFAHWFFPELEREKQSFLLLRQLYDNYRETKKRL